MLEQGLEKCFRADLLICSRLVLNVRCLKVEKKIDEEDVYVVFHVDKLCIKVDHSLIDDVSDLQKYRLWQVVEFVPCVNGPFVDVFVKVLVAKK